MNQEITCWNLWNTQHRTERRTDYLTGLADRLANALRRLDLHQPRIVELGCGTGWFAPIAMTMGRSYHGVDLSPDAITVAQRTAPHGATFAAADLHDWTTSEPFDLAVSIDALAYVRDQPQVLRRIYDGLVPGGWFAMTMVNPIVFSRLSWVKPPLPGQQRQWRGRHELWTLLTAAGFQMHTYRTVCPSGDQGWLRWVTLRTLQRFIPGWTTMLECANLGQYQIIIAQKPHL